MSQSPPGSTESTCYDAVVIGAGLSGLTAASFLSQAGARVLVCEQAGQVGGLFNSFRRDGYQFDGGIKAVENSAVMKPMLAQLGLLEQVGFQTNPIALVTGGCVQPVRDFTDVEAYFHLLQQWYPAETEGLQRVLKDTRTVYHLLDALLCFPIPFFDLPGQGNSARSAWFKANGPALAHLPGAAGLMRRELRPYLEQHLHTPGLVNLLSDLFPDGTSAFFGLGYFRMFLDYSYPRGGICAIPNALAGVIKAGGGEIRLNTRVEQILLKGGQAVGVRLAGGEEIRGGHVIAASDLRGALCGLLPAGILPAGFEKRLRRARVSHSVVNVFLGLDIPVERLHLPGSQHLFYSPDLDGITEDDRISREDYFTHVPQEISIPCLHQPDLAPPGKTGINLSAMTSWQYCGGWELDAGAYEQRKQRIAREMVASLEKWLPGISQHIELCITSTPRTLVELTGNTHGAIMGWSYHRKYTLPRGQFWQMRSSVRTPVPRLLTAGHWSFSPGGSPVVVLTGKLAAEHVLKNSTQTARLHEAG